MIVIEREEHAPMDEIMLIVALINCVINLIGLVLRIREFKHNKSRS